MLSNPAIHFSYVSAVYEALCPRNVSLPWSVLPRTLHSTSVTSLQRYYGPSDFLIAISAPSLLHLSADTSLREELSGSPTFTYLLWSYAVLFDPGGVPHTCPLVVCRMVLSDLSTSSATPEMALTRLNHFNLTAYGLQSPCLRLTYDVTDASSRLGMEYVGSTLLQSHFQRPADKHLVAH